MTFDKQANMSVLWLFVSMETFPEACGRMLREFEIQLNHSPSPINFVRLIQLMAINMFAVDNTAPKGSITLVTFFVRRVDWVDVRKDIYVTEKT